MKKWALISVAISCIVAGSMGMLLSNLKASTTLSTPIAPAMEPRVSIQHRFISIPNQINDQGAFVSPQQIQAYVDFPTPLQGPHHFEARWYRPDGLMQERSEFTHTYSPTDPASAYFWIRFPESSSILNIGISGLESSEKINFNGIWRFEALCDGVIVKNTTFTVQRVSSL